MLKIRQAVDRGIMNDEIQGPLKANAITSTQYQDFVKDASFYYGHGTGDYNELVYIALGIAGEAGEAADAIKKVVRETPDKYDKALQNRMPQIVEEVGDVLWYIAAFCNAAGIGMDELMWMNRAKLEVRYGARATSVRSENSNITHDMEGID